MKFIFFCVIITGGVFIVIFVGIVLACITLAVEYCWFKLYRGRDLDAIKAMHAENQGKLAVSPTPFLP